MPFDALKPLAGRALETALNRAVALDPDTGAALAALDGRRISLALESPPLALDIAVHRGHLQVGPPLAKVEAVRCVMRADQDDSADVRGFSTG